MKEIKGNGRKGKKMKGNEGEDGNGNPKLEKLFYQAGEAQEGAHNLINKVQVFGIKNPSTPIGADTYTPNKKMSEMIIDMEEVKEHVSKVK